MEQLMIKRDGRPVAVAEKDEVKNLDLSGYEVAPATKGNLTWWEWYRDNVLTKTLVAQAAAHGSFELEDVCWAMRENPDSWRGYYKACQESGLSNREWDPVIWAIIKPIKARVVRVIAKYG
jgi:hypothetical protein